MGVVGNGGFDFTAGGGDSFCRGADVCDRLQWAERGRTMIENVVSLILSALLLVYLVYALLKPEKF